MSQPSREWWQVEPYKEEHRNTMTGELKGVSYNIPAILAKHEKMVMEKAKVIATEESERLDSDRPSPHDVFHRILSRLSNPK